MREYDYEREIVCNYVDYYKKILYGKPVSTVNLIMKSMYPGLIKYLNRYRKNDPTAYLIKAELAIFKRKKFGIDHLIDKYEAFEYLKKAVEWLDDRAHYLYGVCYFFGIGTSMDYHKGFKITWRTAFNGYAPAFIFLYSLFKREAIRRNKPKFIKDAIFFLEKAAELGLPESIYRLANHYFTGDIIPKDYEMAYYWYERLAKISPMHYHKNFAYLFEHGLGVTRNTLETANIYDTIAYYTDDMYAIFKSGELYFYFGYYYKGYWRLKVATEHDIVEAQVMLSEICSKDVCIELKKDDEKACYWALSAALNGDIPSMTKYARFCLEGIGREKDVELAYEYFKKAALLGDQEARSYLYKEIT